MVADDDFKQHSDRQIAAKRQRDFDDLQYELAGLSNGRMQRFGVSHSGKVDAERKKDQEARAHLSALEQLLRDDPDYAAIWNGAMELLIEAEQAADKVLDQAKADLDTAKNNLEDVQNRANQLPNGTRIYKDADGNVWTEDGRLVSGEDLEGVVWKDDAPSYEDYLNGKDAIASAEKQIKDIQDYIYNVLGPSRDKLTDPDNPPRPDEITGIQDDISKGRDALGLSQSQDVSAPDASADLAKIKLPDLGG